ncbi:probable aspergillopepsin A precursor [Phialocephala subalpina]|uniref:Probable aspergillopepsin A n=1 Tax=Phialocephala subalpina TaxID=576137 RepID=A0A1L7XIF2_9HELO|nr:probable aspergillopepsin A precursor [Phialocephala subalpina]
MPSITTLHTLLLLVLVTFALAAPQHGSIQKRGSFVVKRVPNPAFKGRTPGAGTRALIKAHRKYSIPLPAGLVDAMNAANAGSAGGVADALTNSAALITGATEDKAAKKKGKAAAAAASNTTTSATNATAGTGIVAATPEQGDVEYLAPISIGGQTMNMDFDSGSSDLWVFNTQLSTASQTGHTNFNPQKSTSFKLMQGASFTISYGDGSGAAGNVGTDTVNIGGATVTSQAIELATAVSTSFVQDTNSNGLVGLAFSKLNTVKPTAQKTFFDNAMPNLAMPVFTADLRKAAAGAYTFGAIDSTKFNGSLSWAAVNTTNGFWQFSSTKFQVGTGAAMAVSGGQAIADTGTTLMLANAAIVNAYYSQVTGAVNNATVGGVTFPCNAVLPDLMVDVGGNYMAKVRGDDINFAAVDATGASCFGGLQAIQSDLQIYGDIMFKSQFVAFNGGNNSIGMAEHQS